MELIKRTINLGTLRSRKTPLVYELLTKELRQRGNCCVGLNNREIIIQNAEIFDLNWGKLDFEYIHLNVFLTQNVDDMGLFTDDPDYIEYPGPVDYTLISSIYTGFTAPSLPNTIFANSYLEPFIRFFGRLNGQTASDYFASGGVITGLTNEKLYSVTSYVTTQPFIVGKNLNIDPTNYFTGVDGMFTNYTAYTLDAQINNVTGSGVHYYTYDFLRLIYNETINKYFSIPYTEFSYQSEGWNVKNTTLSALLKEEKYFGVVFPPKVENNVFIDRGGVSVFEYHSRLNSILSIKGLEVYGNGFYKLRNT